MKRLEQAISKLESYGFKVDNKDAIRQIAESGNVYVPKTQSALRSFIQQHGGVYYEYNQNGTNKQAYFTPERMETMYQFRVSEARMGKKPISQFMAWRGMEKAEQMGKEFRPLTKKEQAIFDVTNQVKGLRTSMNNAGIPIPMIDEVIYMLENLKPEQAKAILEQNQYVYDFFDSDQVAIKSNFSEFYQTIQRAYKAIRPNDNVFEITPKNEMNVRIATQTNFQNESILDLLSQIKRNQERR